MNISVMNSKKELITFIKYTLVGILGAGVGAIIVTYFTHKLPEDATPLSYIVPYLLSVEAGILVTFYPNDVWVFREEQYKLNVWQRLMAYHGALFGGFVIQTIVFALLILINAPTRTAYFMGIGAAALWNYIVSRKAVFAGGEKDKNSGIWSRFSRKRSGSDFIPKE